MDGLSELAIHSVGVKVKRCLLAIDAASSLGLVSIICEDGAR